MELRTKSQVLDAVLERIYAGESLRSAAEKECGTVSKFMGLIEGVRELKLRYARAMEARSDVLADEIIEIADTDPDPQRARNRIQARQWYAGKLNPKVYGERLDLTVNATVSVADALAEARGRLNLRPSSDQAEAIDAEVIDSSTVKDSGPADGQSVDPPKSKPDPFS